MSEIVYGPGGARAQDEARFRQQMEHASKVMNARDGVVDAALAWFHSNPGTFPGLCGKLCDAVIAYEALTKEPR